MDTPRVALVTLGCARNEVDSEELAGRMAAAGFALVEEVDDADAVLVNTCGFIDAAKRESIDVLLASAGPAPSGEDRAVVAVGCMAERYGSELAAELPEADAVLGFDAYPEIGERLRSVLAGDHLESHVPRDRRTLLPMAPADRGGHDQVHRPGAAAELVRQRITSGPVASLKIASGCDRRCAFCAIPSFRGAFVSRPQDEILQEARWLAGDGVRELLLVSENSTSYGKDFGDPRALERLMGELAGVDGVERIRVAYLQPAEIRPALIQTMVALPEVADYFDLSFQHASRSLLRRMRRFGGTSDFLALIDSIRAGAPGAGIRTNVIVGFPGETEADVAELIDFLGAAQLDAVGVFGYSDEDGTEAVGLDGHLDEAEIRARVEEVASAAEEVMAQRAEDRVGESIVVLVESVEGMAAEGRAAHQGPEDGSTTVHLTPNLRGRVGPGSLLQARVVASEGVDLRAVEMSVVQL